jgi:hypothetical protein
MINRQTWLALLLFAGISTFSFSQTAQKNTEIQHKTDVNKDIDVARVYEQVIREGYGTPFIYKKLATVYYFNNQYGKALIYFKKLFATKKNTDPEMTRRYQQTLKAVASGNP